MQEQVGAPLDAAQSPQDRPMESGGIDRFIGEVECLKITDLSRTTRWRLERQNEFPKRRRISPNRSAWLLSEIRAWLKAKADGGTQEGRPMTNFPKNIAPPAWSAEGANVVDGDSRKRTVSDEQHNPPTS